jgi:lactoylglutathione lyase
MIQETRAMMFKTHLLGVALATLGLALCAPSLSAQTLPYDHMHFNVPDPDAATAWYIKYMGGTRSETAGTVNFGTVLFIFRKAADAPGSAGSVIDHIGFSFPDLDARMTEWQAAGIKVVTPVRDVPGLFKLGFIEDPWGTKIEVVQDTETLGFHHIHLRSADPDAMYAWLTGTFGGEKTKLRGRMDAVKYNKLWVLVQKANDTPAPSTGHSIDHLGWGVANLDATAAALKAKDVKFTMEPRAIPVQNIKIAFVEGPGGLRVELVQR